MIFFLRVFDLLLLGIRAITLATSLMDFWIVKRFLWNERRNGLIVRNLDKFMLEPGWHIEQSFLLWLCLSFRKTSVNHTGLGVHWCLTCHRLGGLGFTSVPKSLEKLIANLIIVILLFMNRKLGSRQGTLDVLIFTVTDVLRLFSFQIFVSLP